METVIGGEHRKTVGGVAGDLPTLQESLAGHCRVGETPDKNSGAHHTIHSTGVWCEHKIELLFF